VRVLRLPDGRTLAYEVHGDPSPGAPTVLLFHGAPGSRLFVPEPNDGVRLVTFDRPGYGGSDPHPGRRLADTAADGLALADHLDAGRFAVAGWSGGGPFATATAVHAPERAVRLAIVSAPGPLDEVPGSWEALGDYRRPTAEMARREPARSERAIARHMTPYLADPESFLGRDRGGDCDMLRVQVREALRPGAHGIAQDLVAMWVPWGFCLADVEVDTQVWHGALDPHNDADTATYAAAIPGASRTVWEGEGHLGIVHRWPEVLAWLAGAH
jgi:pimeloyl-ACP methyl ester carboxylesterase